MAEESTVLYFGRRWDAPHFDEAVETPTPVGDICPLCLFDIDEGDDGTWMSWVSPTGIRARAMHLECFLRVALGPPAHVAGIGTCPNHPDDDRPWREQGREVIRLLGREAWLDG